MSANKALRFGSLMVASLRKTALEGQRSSVLKRSMATAMSKRAEDIIKVQSGIVNTTTIRAMSSATSLEEKFKQAVDTVPKLKSDPGNEVKLRLYGLYKQATEGVNNKPKPGMMDFVGKAKYEAWAKLGSMTKEKAMETYLQEVEKLVKEIGLEGPAQEVPQGVEEVKGGQLLKEIRDQVCWITMNRPKKFNALTTDMYEGLTELINEASDDPRVKVVVLTGNGEYYSAGNDLNNFMQWAQGTGGKLEDALPAATKRLQDFVNSFIDCKKAFIAAVNGPAVGIPVTLLALCDLVVCSDRASFQTPFTQLGQSPEACASATFPAIMGMSRATKMLMFNYKMPAKEALECGFVAEVIPHEKFYDRVNEILYSDLGIVKNCYPNSLQIAKSLIRDDAWKAKLKEVNARESVTLGQRFISDECADALKKFFARKQK